jgi:hypothetical protein
MILLQWNALRPGHHVLVHDDDDPEMPLLPGVIATIQTAPSSNDIGIRIFLPTGRRAIRRPRRLAVHLPQLDPTESCWRCAITNASELNERHARSPN